MSDRVRLFLGLAPPDDTRALLARALDEVARTAPRARHTRPGNLHLTLLFLGAVPRERVPAIERVLALVAARTEAFALTAAGAGTFGGRRPRVLFAEVGGEVERAAALAAALSEACEHPLDRPFTGHVTLARARSRGGDPLLAEAARSLAGAVFGPLPARELVLFESRSTPAGVQYLPLAAKSLLERD